MVRVAVGAVVLWGVSLVAQAQLLAAASVSLREVDETIVAEAQVEAVRQSVVAAQVPGRVVAVSADSGDSVRAGQLLVKIDASESAAAMSGAQAQLANAKLNFERTQRLYSQKYVSQAALDRARADYLAAQAAAGQTSAVHGYSQLLAPYAGKVAARQVEVGDMASPGVPLMTVFDPARMRAIAEVPQYQLAKIRAGSRVVVEVPALGQRYTVSAYTVLPALDQRTHTSTIRVNLPADAQLAPGMSARAWFAVGKAMKLLVPAAAVLRRSELTAVYVVDAKGGVHLRQVRLGAAVASGELEVLSGLAAGERVALDPIKAGMVAQTPAASS